MTQKAIPLLLNPAAGRGRAGKNAASIAELFEANGVETELIESTAVGDLEQRVYELAMTGVEQIIVAGGDGSLHEAVNGILNAGHQTGLGLIPTGTGNDFAKACSIPLDWAEATTQLAARLRESVPARFIDAGRMNDRYFANGAGIGFDAKINLIANKYRLPIGDLVYLFAVLQGIWDGVITPNVVMRYGDKKYEGPVTIANISNGAWVGGMFHIAPMAKNDDGTLDLVYAAPVTRLRVLALLPKLIRGTHLDEPDIHCDRIRSFELIADAPVPSHLDGEIQPLGTDFRIELLESALALL